MPTALLGLKRERLPLSTVSPFDNALDVGDLGAMFGSHVISTPKAPDEFRVLVLGDSTIWGLQLGADEVLPGQLNQLGLTCGRQEGALLQSQLPKIIGDEGHSDPGPGAAIQNPDAIIWLVTWYTLSPKTRVDHWLITQNPDAYERLATRFDFLPKDYRPPEWDESVSCPRPSALSRQSAISCTRRSSLATERDQIPGPPQVPAAELSADETFEGLKPPTLRRNQVSIDQIEDFYDLANGMPILLVNEPILVMKDVANSDVRYDSYYPRWVYDQYRTYLAEAAASNGWNYLDLWDSFPEQAFADTPLHLKPEAHSGTSRVTCASNSSHVPVVFNRLTRAPANRQGIRRT